MVVEIFFMTKSPLKNVPDVGIELGAASMPSRHASDRATAPGEFAFFVGFVFNHLNLILMVVYSNQFLIFK